MRIDIENHIMDITHFLYSTEPTDGTCKDCSDRFKQSDTQTPTKLQTLTTARAETLCKQNILDKFIDFEAKMRVQRKKEAEARQRQIAATIRYISWGVIAAISIGGFALLYFFTEFLRGLK